VTVFEALYKLQSVLIPIAAQLESRIFVHHDSNVIAVKGKLGSMCVCKGEGSWAPHHEN